MKKRFLNWNAALLISAITLISCGGESKTKSTPTHDHHTSSTASESSDAENIFEAPDGAEAAIAMEAGDDMKFNYKEIHVKEGQTIKLTLKHTGKMDVKTMGHNIVIIPDEMDLQMFATDAMKSADNDYIPANQASKIVAHTKMIGGGESTEISFSAPAPGTYKFVCTFPGHWAAMNGKFIVK